MIFNIDENNISDNSVESNDINENDVLTEHTQGLNNDELVSTVSDRMQTITGKTASYEGFKNKWSYEEYERSKSVKKARNSYRGLRTFAVTMTVIAVVSLTCLGVVLAGGLPFGDVPDETEGGLPSISIPATHSREPELTRNEIIKKAKPGVVGIICEIIKNEMLAGKSIGSGFIITDDGYIVTNHHVISEASKIKVVMMDGTEYAAEIIGSDELTDVAVIKIDDEGLPAIEIGNSDALEEGDTVIAIGTPAGIDYAGTSTHGMVSAINRDVKITDEYGTLKKTMTVIQIDASINKGNSGGPVLNGQGQVIGVATLKLGNGYEGMGFALPINGVVPIVNELIAYGEVKDRPNDSFVSGRPAIGVRVETVTEADAKEFGLPVGAFVRFVEAGSTAMECGIEMGDIITKFNGVDIVVKEDLTSAVLETKPGDKVEIVIYRSVYGEDPEKCYRTLTITVGMSG